MAMCWAPEANVRAPSSIGEGFGPTTYADLYSFATNTWSLTGSMNFPRFYHTMTLLNNGQVLVAGGYYRNAAGTSGVVDTAELYTP